MKTALLKEKLKLYGIDIVPMALRLREFLLKKAAVENKWNDSIEKLKSIVPDEDIVNQEFSEKTETSVARLKRRALHWFQCSLMLKALEKSARGKLTVVDIGDSAGTHMRYLKTLTKDKFDIDTISVNLDTRAIEKIRAAGLEAIHSRAEELDLGEKNIDLFTSFQMVEHLHNPAIFFRRLAKKSKGNRILVTVPYLSKSRVGLHNIRNGFLKPIRAEEEHIFELSPEDWSLLMLHSGWKPVYSEIYYQYPKRSLLKPFWKLFWQVTDYEGYWGVILEKDTKISDYYQDWED